MCGFGVGLARLCRSTGGAEGWVGVQWGRTRRSRDRGNAGRAPCGRSRQAGTAVHEALRDNPPRRRSGDPRRSRGGARERSLRGRPGESNLPHLQATQHLARRRSKATVRAVDHGLAWSRWGQVGGVAGGIRQVADPALPSALRQRRQVRHAAHDAVALAAATIAGRAAGVLAWCGRLCRRRSAAARRLRRGVRLDHFGRLTAAP